MRFILLTGLICFMFAPVAAHASDVMDEFGPRFHGEAPAGLGEFDAPSQEFPDIAMDDAAQDMQDIMPAAGDEQLEYEDNAYNSEDIYSPNSVQGE